MLVTLILVLAAMLAWAALDLWLFWRLSERDGRRHVNGRHAAASSAICKGAWAAAPPRRSP
jgi:hypothetical protein